MLSIFESFDFLLREEIVVSFTTITAIQMMTAAAASRSVFEIRTENITSKEIAPEITSAPRTKKEFEQRPEASG